MKKKLKIRFIKLEKGLVMQILEQRGTFPETKHVKTSSSPGFGVDKIFLCDEGYFTSVPDYIMFGSNQGRDEYLTQVISWISIELFAIANGSIEVGKIVKVKDFDDAFNMWREETLIAIIPNVKKGAFITSDGTGGWLSWDEARPVDNYPIIDDSGEVYTWES